MIIRSVVQAATIAGTPPVNQDFLNGSGPGSNLTPVAALYELGGCTTVGTPATNGDRYGIGMTDGTLQRSIALLMEDAASNADTGNRFDTATVFQLSLTGVETSRDGEANWNSWQTGGSRVAWSDLLATALQCKATHFYDCQAAVVEFAGNATANSSSAVTGLGFAPDLAISISHYAAFSADGTSTNGRIALGYAVKTPSGTVQQIAFTKYAKDNPGLQTSNAGVLRDDCFCAKIADGSNGARLDLTAWNSDGATIFTRDVSESVSCAILFVKTGRRLWAGIPSLVTSSTGVKAITDPGFPVASYFVLASALASKNTRSDTASSNGWSAGSYTGDEESSLGGFEPDASAPDTRSVNESKIVRVMLNAATGTDDWVAVHSSLDATGFSINVTTASITGDRIAGFVAIGMPLIVNAETVSISDSAAFTGSVEITEPIVISDSLSATSVVVTSETVSIADAFEATGEVVLTESVEITDGLLATGIIETTEQVAISDELDTFLTFETDETVEIADSFQAATTLVTSEDVAISDEFVTRTIGSNDLALVTSEDVLVTDSASFLFTDLTVGEDVHISDAFEAETYLVTDESISVEDDARFRGEGVGVIANESVLISDGFVAFLGRVLTGDAESVLISDSANFGAGPVSPVLSEGKGKTVQAGAELGVTAQANAQRGASSG